MAFIAALCSTNHRNHPAFLCTQMLYIIIKFPGVMFRYNHLQSHCVFSRAYNCSSLISAHSGRRSAQTPGSTCNRNGGKYSIRFCPAFFHKQPSLSLPALSGSRWFPQFLATKKPEHRFSDLWRSFFLPLFQVYLNQFIHGNFQYFAH